MSIVANGIGRVSDSLFRTVEFLLAAAVLLLTGFGAWLVLTEPGSPEGGGVIVGLVLLAAAASVLLAATVLLHVGIDAVRGIRAE